MGNIEQQLFSPDSIRPGEDADTPVITRGFLLDATNNNLSISCEFPNEVTIGVDERGRTMVPVETATGVPLPIINGRLGNKPNRDHSFYYAEKYKSGSLGQQALRYSRLQRTNRVNHQAKHDFCQGGIKPPEESQTQFNLISLSLAGYITNFGLKFKTKPLEMEVVELAAKERLALRKTGIFTIEATETAHSTIGQFLMHHALSRSLDSLDEIFIEEFLHPRIARSRKDYIGVNLIDMALEAAVETVNPMYEAARHKHLLKRRKDPPKTAWEEIKSYVQGHEADYLEVLEDGLRAQYIGEVAA